MSNKSADKRSVSTDALETLGTILTGEEHRDAIHVGVEPAIAGERLKPGQNISFNKGIAYASKGKMVGIVDPFLKIPVEKGQKFWLIVYPRQITSLRHVWEHPDFEASVDPHPNEEQKAEAEQWLREFARDNDIPDYETVIEAFLDGSADHGSFHFGVDASGKIPDEFWDNMEIVTGQKITNRPEYFSCSC